MSPQTLAIHNEEEAWATLLDTLTGRLPEDILQLNFDNWPILKIKLTGDKFQSSITPRVMEALIQLQKDIYQSYAKIIHGKASAAVLTDQEKEKLELVVQVHEGSSEYWAMLKEPAIELAKGVARKMEGRHWVAVAIVTALAWSGQSCYRSYLQNQKELKQIETQQMADETDLRRWEIFNDAVNREPELLVVKDSSEEFYNALIKAGATADQMEIAGKTLDTPTMQQLARTSRTRSAEIQLNGVCKIQKVDSSSIEGFKVEVLFEDGRKFMARLEEAFIATRDENKRLIQAAEWEKRPIYLQMNAKELRGEITKATIIGVREPREEELPADL